MSDFCYLRAYMRSSCSLRYLVSVRTLIWCHLPYSFLPALFLRYMYQILKSFVKWETVCKDIECPWINMPFFSGSIIALWLCSPENESYVSTSSSSSVSLPMQRYDWLASVLCVVAWITSLDWLPFWKCQQIRWQVQWGRKPNLPPCFENTCL